MPLARIVTSIPESAESLASYLAQRGYSVEIVAPGEPADHFADLEVTLEALAAVTAFERAAELASRLGADVLVAPGATPESETQPTVAEVALPENVEPQEPLESWLSERTRHARVTLGNWQRRGREIFAAARHNFNDSSRALRATGLARAKQWLARTAMSTRQSWQFLRQTVNQRAAAIHAKLEQARVQAAERARLRALKAEPRVHSQPQEEERRLRESAVLLRQNEEEARGVAASESSDTPAAEPEEIADLYVAPSVLRKSARRRSPLVAYTRNRTQDWKMAFLGAAAASAIILIISFSVVHKPLPKAEPQPQFPFGAAAQPQAPTLIIPAVVTPPVLPPVVVKKTNLPAPKPPLIEPETEPTDDEYFEEVVVRHYRAQESAKVQTGADGVKRISDLD